MALRANSSSENHRKLFFQNGFALLITIVLVSFLVLILVALATLTRVETQVATNTRKLDAARNHALMALNIALGQLQQHAGPDTRLTAQANLLSDSVGNPWFTGVWTADTSGSPVLRSWLVSGNETTPTRFGPSSIMNREGPVTDTNLILDANGLATNGPETGDPNRVQLVGANTASTTGTAMDNGSVVVPGVPINAIPPGFTSERTVGRYAFWVGDQGVKASLALPDRASEVTYAPWYDPTPVTGYDQRARIRQQIATSPTYFRRFASEEYGFDPLKETNSDLLPRVLDTDHFDLLTPAVSTAPLDDFRREQFHRLTDRSHAVLANTLPNSDSHRGLQRDLSQAPQLLGNAFAAQNNLTAYMEAPSATNTAVPPITTYDSPRRRYKITVPSTSAATSENPAMSFKVAPILSSFMLQFRIVRSSGNVEVKARMMAELWNPYTSALVPETLSLHITGLPQIRIVDAGGTGSFVDVNLQNPPAILTNSASDNPLVVNLPFTANGNTDRSSWLPGRIYSWTTSTGASATADLTFYNKNLNASGWTFATIALGATDDRLSVATNNDTTLKIELKNSSGSTLATYTSPTYSSFSIMDVEAASASNWVFGFGFRLRQPSTLNKDRDWLQGASENFTGTTPSADIYAPFNELLGIDPDAYVATVQTATDIQNFLVFRVMGTTTATSRSATVDVPVFELPRLPYLSVGELQQTVLPDSAPFSVGNAWGGQANGWFDRYFFSGLTSPSAIASVDAGQPPPNWNLQPLNRNVTSAGELSSAHLLQAGGFNIHSALPEAWRAVLSGVRFSQDRAFNWADIENNSSANVYTGSQPITPTTTTNEVLSDGTLADDADPVTNPIGGPAFFRFPQSAQETYFWAQNTNLPSDFDSNQAFRQGVRGGDQPIDGSTLHSLTTAQIARLADAIVTRLRSHITTSGPYRSLQDFLATNTSFSGRNLLEQAIHDANINPAAIAPDSPVASVNDIGFSSLTLTSADIMTALAPYLRTRSDTFVVRTYGESLNPITGEVEGRSWCEATVQRFPETVDPGDDLAAPSATGFGRKFKITRFRWLSPSDI